MVESGLGPKERVRQRLRTGADYTESKMRRYLTKKLLSRCHSQRKDSLAPEWRSGLSTANLPVANTPLTLTPHNRKDRDLKSRDRKILNRGINKTEVNIIKYGKLWKICLVIGPWPLAETHPMSVLSTVLQTSGSLEHEVTAIAGSQWLVIKVQNMWEF